MYCNQKSNICPVLAAALGAVTLALRWRLYASGLDEKNLLVSGHVLNIPIWIIFVVAVAVVVIDAVKKNSAQWEDTGTQPDFWGALGAVALAVAIGWSVCSQGMPFTTVQKMNTLVGILSAFCLLVIAFCAVRAKRPFFLCYGCVCVYFCVHLVMCYGQWSANPQIQDYVFATLACVCIGLFAYQKTAVATGLGNGKLQYALGLLAGYLGIGAMYGMECPWLYPAAGFWALTNLSRPVSDQECQAKEGL